MAHLHTHNLKKILYLPLSLSFEVGTIGTWVIDELPLAVTGNTKNKQTVHKYIILNFVDLYRNIQHCVKITIGTNRIALNSQQRGSIVSY